MSAKITDINISLQGSTGTTAVLRWMYTGSNVTVKVYKSKKEYIKKTVSPYKQISSFNIQWQYYQDGNWYVGEETENYSKGSTKIARDGDGTKYQVTYSAPAEATKVRARVYCKSGTYKKVTGKKKKYKAVSTEYFSSSWSEWVEYNFSTNAPDAPSVTADCTGTTIVSKVTTDPSDTKTTNIRFRYYAGSELMGITQWLPVENHYVEYSYAGEINKTYRVQAQAMNNISGGESIWGAFSEVKTVPAAPTNLTAVAGSEEGTIIIDWDDVPGVSGENGYSIEYANNKSYFDSSSEVQSASSTASTITLRIDLGYTWYFRVRASNAAGNSAWSDIIEQVVAKPPGAPTTWTNKSNFKTDETVRLYFTHNASDNSKMQKYTISYKINGVQQSDIVVNAPTTTGENPIFYYDLGTYSADTTILWKIKTKGAHADYGPYSVEREVKVYVQPAINISVNESITKFPIDVVLTTSPSGQKAISYSVVISSTESYETYNHLGNEIFVNANSVLYSKIFVNSNDDNPFEFSILPSEIAVEQGQTYLMRVEVSMNSGLTAFDEAVITMDFDRKTYEPDAELDFNYDQYTCLITPVCYSLDAPYVAEVAESTYEMSHISFNRSVFENYVNGEYGTYPFIFSKGWKYNNASVNLANYGITLSGVSPKKDDEIIITYERRNDLDPDVKLSVYRKNTDSSFTEIITDLDNTGNSVTIDPHPNFGTATYRIIARNPETGAIGYNDVDIDINISSIVIQWDEEYKSTITRDESLLDLDAIDPIYSGSILELPYNIKTSESNSKDISLVEYIGRSHPVSYYGTQRGSKASWNTEIDKRDKVTLNLLRILDVWPGDVYVREPNGTGYKASISISFSIDYDSLVIPITIDVTHVE